MFDYWNIEIKLYISNCMLC